MNCPTRASNPRNPRKARLSQWRFVVAVFVSALHVEFFRHDRARNFFQFGTNSFFPPRSAELVRPASP
jgi:hypothetical protein